ncbi:MAG: HWE histidine kinase domain-containing protein [Alteraurantiacibacter sp.]
MTKFPLIRHALLAKRTQLECFALAGLLVGGATALRLAVDHVIPNMPFITYFPCVMIMALLTDWRWGAPVSVVSAILGASLFSGSTTFGLQFVAFLIISAIFITIAELLRRLIAELEVARQVAEYQSDELLHRVGNTLAVVQTIAAQTLRHSAPDEFMDAFGSRLRALDKAHTLLRKMAVGRCSLSMLVLESCQPFCDRRTLKPSGPDCHLPAQSCVPLMHCLHELATNAVMHGALTAPGGRIAVSWVIDEEGRATVTWNEEGGPPVAPPTRKGMGTGLLRSQSGLADVKLIYATAGVRCVIVIDGAELG